MKSIWKLAGCPFSCSSFSPGSGSEDDGIAVDEVVDGNHEHGAGRQRDRDSADR